MWDPLPHSRNSETHPQANDTSYYIYWQCTLLAFPVLFPKYNLQICNLCEVCLPLSTRQYTLQVRNFEWHILCQVHPLNVRLYLPSCTWSCQLSHESELQVPLHYPLWQGQIVALRKIPVRRFVQAPLGSFPNNLWCLNLWKICRVQIRWDILLHICALFPLIYWHVF